MFRIPSTFTVSSVAALFLALTPAQAKETPRDRYNAAMDSVESDPQMATTSLEQLCDEGFSRACDRLGYFSFKGIGIPQDADQAIAYYQQAVEQGSSKSLLSLGKIHLTQKSYEAASESLLAAVAQGDQRAEAVLAWAHATGRLGPIGDPDQGLSVLITLAANGDRDGQISLLDALTRTPSHDVDVSKTLTELHSRHTQGDAKAAEALLRYYRIVGHPRGTIETRATLLETDGLRDKIRVEEGLFLARDLDPEQFWSTSEEIVRSAPNDVFARGLSVTAKINKNAYVRIVQMELRDLGYRVGRASPYLNRPLIRSINAFCRETGQQSACVLGPLKSTTIKAVASEIAQLRAEP
ncbi:tetratricopeptide repeat protein [Shimia haliotis]|uniref:Sel1 repeat-containing protein n=1 Tax=Shimia haliotis TaxID=1280847 RepID=A0A1I4HJU6_9RHOB|nr:tetratricopeptide repeat protein [Shimia haliotis]SFL42588.1 Sel1 repeat-containing protein [Shimia haliotis]